MSVIMILTLNLNELNNVDGKGTDVNTTTRITKKYTKNCKVCEFKVSATKPNINTKQTT